MSKRGKSIEELEVSLRNAFRHNELEDLVSAAHDLLNCHRRWQPVYGLLENWSRGGITPDGARTVVEIACLFDAVTPDRRKSGIPNPLPIYVEALRAWWDRWAMWIEAKIESRIALVPFTVFSDGVAPQTKSVVDKAIWYGFVVEDEMGLRIGPESPMLLRLPECVCSERTTLLSSFVYSKQSDAYRVWNRCPRCNEEMFLRGKKADVILVDDHLLMGRVDHGDDGTRGSGTDRSS